MAYACLCIHCGRQESVHDYPDQDCEGEGTVFAGYGRSLQDCPGFTYSEQDLTELEMNGLDSGGPARSDFMNEQSY